MSTLAPRVWVVLITCNRGLEDTRKCLRSLSATGCRNAVLVDNASEDNPIPAIRAEFPWCRILTSRVNWGFTGGCNAGIRFALAEGADWIVLLNNDTIVAPEFMERLTEAARSWPDYQVIGPVIMSMDEPDKLQTDGCIFNDPAHPGFFQRKPVPITGSSKPSIVEVDVVNGCCMMVARRVFERIGLLDERFFAYHEETDFCQRARAAGFRCGVIGDALVWHRGTATPGRIGRPLPRYYDARNLGLLLWKHKGARHRGRTVWGSALTYFKYTYYRYCVEREAGYPEAADAVIEGLCDAGMGRWGPQPRRQLLSVPLVRAFFELMRCRPRWSR